jgi:hypothetical protein
MFYKSERGYRIFEKSKINMKNYFVFLIMLSFMISCVIAYDTTITLESDISCTAEESSEQSYSGDTSAKLYVPEKLLDHISKGRVHIDFNEEITLGEIDSIEWMQYVTSGYPAHVDILLDIGNDGLFLNNDNLVVEFAYNPMDHYARGSPYTVAGDYDNWFSTFKDEIVIDNDTNMWLASGASGPPSWTSGTLKQWKDGLVSGIVDESTIVLAIEIEIDNKIAESQAYIDDIRLNDILLENFEDNYQELNGELEEGYHWSIEVMPSSLSFEAIPRGENINHPANEDITISTFGSNTKDDNVYVYTDIVENGDFFTTLLYLNDNGWKKVKSLELIVPEDSSKTYDVELMGSTLNLESGAKSAIIHYTAYGEDLF